MTLSYQRQIELERLAGGVQRGSNKDFPLLASAVLDLQDSIKELRRLFDEAQRLAGREG